MENEDIINRIKFLMAEKRMRQNAFAKVINTDVSNFSKCLNGKSPIGDSLLNRIVVNLGVSKAWLTTGEGVPFPKNSAPDTILVPEIASRKIGTPVYDVDVTAGALSRERMFADDNIIGHISVPGINADCKIVRVSGDSMKPVIKDGDYISVREISDTSVIYWGQIYVVLLEDYRMVKYLRRHPDDNKVILRSENPAYDDIEISRSAIKGLFFVNNILRIENRM